MELDMTINSETKSEIIRLRLVEKWPVGTVAKMLGVHHSVVERLERVLSGAVWSAHALPQRLRTL
jgi:hypothetical protein